MTANKVCNLFRYKQKGPISVDNHVPDIKDMGSNGYPRNAIPFEMRICMDSRKDSCVFSTHVIVEDDFVSFRQWLCLYQYRK